MNKHPDAPTCSATQQRPQAVIIASERDDRMPNEEQDDTRSEAAEPAEEGRRNGERHSRKIPMHGEASAGEQSMFVGSLVRRGSRADRGVEARHDDEVVNKDVVECMDAKMRL